MKASTRSLLYLVILAVILASQSTRGSWPAHLTLCYLQEGCRSGAPGQAPGMLCHQQRLTAKRKRERGAALVASLRQSLLWTEHSCKKELRNLRFIFQALHRLQDSLHP